MRVCVFSAKKVTGGAAIDRLGKARLPIHGEGKRGGEGRERNRAHVAPVTVEKRGGRKGGGARVSFGPPPSTPPPPHFPLKLARGVKQAARLPRFLPFSLAHSLEPKALAREPQVDERHSDREREREEEGEGRQGEKGSCVPSSARSRISPPRLGKKPFLRLFEDAKQNKAQFAGACLRFPSLPSEANGR